MMNNSELDAKVLSLILGGTDTQKTLVDALGLPNFDEEGRAASRVVEGALKRLKSKGNVSFNKELKHWEASKESAPTGDSGVGSEEQAPDVGSPSLTETTGTTMMNESASTSTVDSIDAAINKARASKSKSDTTETGTKRVRLTEEEKLARDAAKAKDRATKKAEREAARAAKKAASSADRKPAHMSKVDKAASKLPALAPYAKDQLSELTTNLPREQVFALAQHLLHFNRTQATERALGQVVKQDDTVKIVGGEPRFIGKVGKVVKAQRIRCYVEVEGAKKPVYLFTSDVEVVSATAKNVAANA